MVSLSNHEGGSTHLRCQSGLADEDEAPAAWKCRQGRPLLFGGQAFETDPHRDFLGITRQHDRWLAQHEPVFGRKPRPDRPAWAGTGEGSGTRFTWHAGHAPLHGTMNAQTALQVALCAVRLHHMHVKHRQLRRTGNHDAARGVNMQPMAGSAWVHPGLQPSGCGSVAGNGMVWAEFTWIDLLRP